MHALLSATLALGLGALNAPSDPPQSRIKVLIVTGANNHDWQWTSPQLQRTLVASGLFDADITTEPAETLADAAALRQYAAFVLDYNGKRWGEPAESNFLAAVRGGTGVAVVHAANNAFPGWVEYEKMVALCWRKGTGHGRFHAFDVEITDRDHPITRGLADLKDHPDELYHKLVPMHGVDYRVLARAMSAADTGGTGRYEPMVLVRSYGRGRVFHTPLGHVWRNVPETRESYADPRFRDLLVRGVEWAATGSVTAVPPNTLCDVEREDGFRLLFDGKSTKGWRGYRSDAFPAAGWRVEQGALHHVAGGGGGDIVTDETFGDFELRFEWAVAKGANSGVIYRCTEDGATTWRTGPEYQVLDDGPRGDDSFHSAAALYGLTAPEGKVVRPAGQFNRGRIVVHEGRVEHWLNGVKVVDCALAGDDWQARLGRSKFKDMPGFARAARGHIALQDHGDEVWYRGLRIREL